jgi:hypothetical protein
LRGKVNPSPEILSFSSAEFRPSRGE